MKNLLLLLTFTFLLFTSSFAQQGTIQLPATGQTISYYPGDDGDLQMGIPIPENRFTDLGDGSCTDALTGLMWVTDANLITSRDPDFDQDRTPGDGDINWKTALDYIQKLNDENYLSHNDWRMPNLVEIRSLADLSIPDTALPQGHPFFNLKVLYWSSTTHELGRYLALCYIMFDYYVHSNRTHLAGEIIFSPKMPDSPDFTFHLFPVRTSGNEGDVELPLTGQYYNFYPGDDGGLKEGITWPSPRLVDNNDETVTDRLTGLMWTQDINVMISRNPEYDTNMSVDGLVCWTRALDYVALLNNENYLGYNDWRLPNRNELTSLMDYAFASPTLPERAPFTNIYEYMGPGKWTSTSWASDASYAWLVRIWSGMMASGQNNYYNKSAWNGVWPVRTDTSPLPSGKISGTITLDGNPFQRAEIVLNGPIKSFIRSNLNGEYEFTNLPDGNYTITPEHKYARFAPLLYEVSISGNEVICDFVATYTRAYGWTDMSEKLFPVGNAAGASLLDLYFIGNEGWIVNHDFDEIYHTSDEGETWEIQQTLRPCNAIYMLSSEEGYAAGESGFIHKTTDGGTTWEFFGTTPARIMSITFTENGTVGYTAGWDGWISKIYNGTVTPEKVSFPDYASIAFTPSGDFGWATACYGRKAVYEDGAWTYYGGAQYYPCLNDVQFVNDNLMWLAHDYGIDRMLINENYSQILSDSAMFQGIYTLTEDSVWAVGANGVIVLTANGSDDTVHFSHDNVGKEWLSDVFAVNAHRAYAVGGNGVLYRYGLLEGFPAGGANILDVVIDQQVSPAVINNDELTVWVEVEQGTDLTQILPAIFISPAASINPPGGSMQDFTFPVTYTVTSENGQTEKDWVVTVTITTGIDEAVEPEILIYPNPAMNELRVAGYGLRVGGTTIELYDINGRKLLEKTIPKGSEEVKIDVSSLQSGLYFCRISTDKYSVTKKLIIN